jgi:hypothetical protein
MNKINLHFILLPNAFAFSSKTNKFLVNENDTNLFLKQNFPHISIINLVSTQLLITDFSDNGHLNETGAKKVFSRFQFLETEKINRLGQF